MCNKSSCFLFCFFFLRVKLICPPFFSSEHREKKKNLAWLILDIQIERAHVIRKLCGCGEWENSACSSKVKNSNGYYYYPPSSLFASPRWNVPSRFWFFTWQLRWLAAGIPFRFWPFFSSLTERKNFRWHNFKNCFHFQGAIAINRDRRGRRATSSRANANADLTSSVSSATNAKWVSRFVY